MPRSHISFVCAVLGSSFLALVVPSCGGGRTSLVARGDGGASQSGVDGSHGNQSGIPTSDDRSCPPATSRCGSGQHARCYALDSDPANCGTCGHACTPGIACSAGVCQQTACTGPVTFQETGRFLGHLSGTKDYSSTVFVGADVNRDGQLDFLEYNAHNEDTPIVIWLGQGDGTFVVSTSYATVGNADTPALPGYAAVADINEDGLADLVVTRAKGASVEVRPGLPGGSFGGRAGVPLDRLLIADLDRDGHIDVVSPAYDLSGFSGNRLAVLRGRGNGTFTSNGSYTIPDDSVWQFELRDWDGDGTLDLVTLGTTLHLLLGKGDGTLAQQQGCGLGTRLAARMLFVDLNQDGKLDVVWPAGGLATVLGSGNCKFSPRTNYPLSFAPGALAAGDVSGDGVLDLVALGIDTMSVSRNVKATLFLGKGDGTFATATDLKINVEAQSIFIADVNDDGQADIVVTGDAAMGNAGIVVYSNTCTR